MKKIFVIAMAFCTAQWTIAQDLKKVWEVTGLEAPESVVQYDGNFYVSNVSGQPAEKNGNGFLSKVGPDGSIIELKWLNGFNAPKGLGVFKNRLYVADIDRVAVVNLDEAKIEKWYTAEGATFLNDIEIDSEGTVYVTDTFGGNAIYQIKDDAISLLIKDERLDYPNGLKLVGELLYVSTWGVVTNPETFGTDVPGSLLAVDLTDNSIQKVSEPFGNLDGLIQYKNDFIVSDWISGKISLVNGNGEIKTLEALNPGTADIEYLAKEQLLLVPIMLDGKLVAFSL